MNVYVHGIPNGNTSEEIAIFKSRLITACEKFFRGHEIEDVDVNISLGSSNRKEKVMRPCSSDIEVNEKNTEFLIQNPFFDFSTIVLPNETIEMIQSSIELLKLEKIVFDDWELRKIEPHPKSALNFYGPPGTGKTMAAHAIANYLQLPIIVASYAEIESKYHGEGPKNVKRLFQTAEKAKAVLFIDEADSLLSKRLTNVTQGSEQAINSMRSQLLINLEQFHGVVIFATNLVENYDQAFETRIQHIKFEMPDKECRVKIWKKHLLPSLPLAEDINIEDLAEKYTNLCGRDIKNIIIQTAIEAARKKINISNSMLEKHALQIIHSKTTKGESNYEEIPLSDEEKKAFEQKIIETRKKR